jgi:hypothetical protein
VQSVECSNVGKDTCSSHYHFSVIICKKNIVYQTATFLSWVLHKISSLFAPSEIASQFPPPLRSNKGLIRRSLGISKIDILFSRSLHHHHHQYPTTNLRAFQMPLQQTEDLAEMAASPATLAKMTELAETASNSLRPLKVEANGAATLHIISTAFFHLRRRCRRPRPPWASPPLT